MARGFLRLSDFQFTDRTVSCQWLKMRDGIWGGTTANVMV